MVYVCFKMHNELFAINISKQCKNYIRKFEIFVGVFIRILKILLLTMKFRKKKSLTDDIDAHNKLTI